MLGGALGFAAVWLSPAILLELPPRLLADGTRGLWPPLALLAGACLTVAILAVPWSALSTEASLPGLLGLRWPADRRGVPPLAVAAMATALLFLWAQLAALGELARWLGWPAPAGIGLAGLVLALLSWADRLARRIAVLGGALAVLGLLVPLAGIMLATDPAWPRVWEAVASRPRFVFGGAGPWVREGQVIRGPGSEVRLAIGEEQRVMLLGRGRVRVDGGDGVTWGRDVSAPVDVTLRPGDRLVVPDGFVLRFQAGRAVPGAPRSGADWVEPGVGPGAWRGVVGLGVTLLLGALGLAPVHGALPAGARRSRRGLVLGAALVGAGLGVAGLWTLYAAWLTPEVYLAGGAGAEVYALSRRVEGLGAAALPLGDLVWLGLAGGGLAAALAALRGVPRSPGRGIGPALVVAAGLLATVMPASPWSLLVLAFGLGASAGAPAAVLACWRERLGALGLSVGAVLGLVAFVALALLDVAGVAGRADRTWPGWLAAWPALVAAPLNALTAWLLSLASPPPAHSSLPPGLDTLHG